MFTGIITDIANVRAIEKTGDTRFEFTTSLIRPRSFWGHQLRAMARA